MVDTSYIWEYLSSFWDDAENKEVIEELWDGIGFSYEYFDMQAWMLKNAIDVPNMKGTYTAPRGIFTRKCTGSYLTEGGECTNSHPTGNVLSIEKLVDPQTGEEYTTENGDYTIVDRIITYISAMPPTGQIGDYNYVAYNITYDATKFIYTVYKNIYPYYPVNNTYSPENYANALRAMLYAWRYGHTANNLNVALNAILNVPYTTFGGNILYSDADYVYIGRDKRYPVEKVALNGYVLTARKDIELRPMSLLSDSLFELKPYINQSIPSEALRSGFASTTLEVKTFAANLEQNQINFMRCFLDNVLPKRYSYNMTNLPMDTIVSEEDVVVG